jgi:hypothetical protein
MRLILLSHTVHLTFYIQPSRTSVDGSKCHCPSTATGATHDACRVSVLSHANQRDNATAIFRRAVHPAAALIRQPDI